MTPPERAQGWTASVARRARALGGGREAEGATASELPPLPTFLIIGAQKAGTRWLRFNLGRHPDVFCVDTELHFFNSRRYRLGLDWYRSQFSGWSGERARGEATPGYTMPRQRPERTAKRIEAALPGVRLLAVLRDPAERTYSAFIHHMGKGRLDPETDLLSYIASQRPEEDRFRLVAGGWYASNLAPYLERFGERLLIALNEDVRDEPHALYRRALEHVGVDPEFLPDELDQVRFANAAPRASRYRAEGEGGRRPLSEEERGALYPHFAAEIDRLEEMLGRDLSRWRP